MGTTPNAVSLLRRRMIEDMMIRRSTKKTQGDHIRPVRAYAAFGHPAEANGRRRRDPARLSVEFQVLSHRRGTTHW